MTGAAGTDPAVDWPLAGMTIPDLLARAAAADPRRVMVTFTDDRDFTIGEVWDRATRVARGLRERGVDRGDRVGIFVGNRIELLTAWFGAFIAGAVAVPLNTAQRGSVLKHMITLTGIHALLVDQHELDAIGDVLADAKGLHTVAVVGDALPGAGTAARLPCVRYADWESAPTGIDPVPGYPHELAALMLTSGSTGPSKAVMWSHRTALMMATVAQDCLEYGPGDVVFTCLPLFHANALLSSFLSGFMSGARVAVAPRFSARTFWREIAEQGATKTSMLGTMPGILYRQPPAPHDRAHRPMRAFMVPAPLGYYKEFEERFDIEIVQFYGLTDMNTLIGVPPDQLDVARSKPTSCGLANPHFELKVVDVQDREVRRGQIGELVARNKIPFTGQLGYFDMPERTVETWRNLWFHTNDRFTQDEDGWFYFVDREQDAIRRSGENVSSIEVEGVLRLHPGVLETAVLSVPSADAEDEIMAVFQVDDTWDGDFEALLRYCYRELAYFAVPRYFRAVSEFPRTSSQKIRKDLLREAGVTNDTWDRGPGGRKALEERIARPAQSLTHRVSG
jgi:crotonobetaine/carnitine-CoA ligase